MRERSSRIPMMALPRFLRGMDACADRLHDVFRLTDRGSLRSKLVLSLAVMFVAMLIVNELVGHVVIRPEFLMFERQAAIRDARRIEAAIDCQIEHFGELNQYFANTYAHTNRVESREHELLWAYIIDGESIHWIQGSQYASDPSIRRLNRHVTQTNSSSGVDDGNVLSKGVLRIENGRLAIFSASEIPSDKDSADRSGAAVGDRPRTNDVRARPHSPSNPS